MCDQWVLWIFTIPVCNESLTAAKLWWTQRRELITGFIWIGGTVGICLSAKDTCLTSVCVHLQELVSLLLKMDRRLTSSREHPQIFLLMSTTLPWTVLCDWCLPPFPIPLYPNYIFELLNRKLFLKMRGSYVRNNQLLNSLWIPFLLDYFLWV